MPLSNFKISKKAGIIAVSSILVVILLGGTSAYAYNSNSLPGSLMYPLKQGWENLSLLVAPTPQAKAKINVEIAHDRIQAASSATVAAPVLAPTLEEVQKNLNSAVEQSKKVTDDTQRKAIQADIQKEAESVETEVRHSAESESSHINDAKIIQASTDAIKQIHDTASRD